MIATEIASVVLAGLLVSSGLWIWRLGNRIDNQIDELYKADDTIGYLENTVKNKQRDIIEYQSRIHELEHEIDGVMKENEIIKGERDYRYK